MQSLLQDAEWDRSVAPDYGRGLRNHVGKDNVYDGEVDEVMEIRRGFTVDDERLRGNGQGGKA